MTNTQIYIEFINFSYSCVVHMLQLKMQEKEFIYIL